MNEIMYASFMDELNKIAEVITRFAKSVVKPTLGKNVRQIAGGATKVRLPGAGWTTIPERMAKRYT